MADQRKNPSALPPETIKLTKAEYEHAVESSLRRLGLTYRELAAQAERRDFTSAAAQTLWVAISPHDRKR